MFSGEDGGPGVSSSVSSSSLLAHIRKRNAAALIPDDTIAVGQLSEVSSSDVSSEHQEFIRELRDFIAFQANVNGQATTEEILYRFSNKVPKEGSLLFKSLLNELCTFYRQNGRGTWRLKTEFQ